MRSPRPTLPGSSYADTFVRAAYREKIGDPAMLTSLNDRLLEITHRAPGESRRVFEPGPNGTWTLTEAPSEMVLA